MGRIVGPVVDAVGMSRLRSMRFAFKTSPQNTTWDDMLAVWRAADDIELFESGWTLVGQ